MHKCILQCHNQCSIATLAHGVWIDVEVRDFHRIDYDVECSLGGDAVIEYIVTGVFMDNKKLIIGVTGTNGAGKDFVAAILQKELGADKIAFSDLLKEELVRRGMENDRKNYVIVGNEFRQKYGNFIWAKMILERFKDSEKPLVVTSVRNSGEVDYLRKHADFTLLAIDAPLRIRYERSARRQQYIGEDGFNDFVANEQKELQSADGNTQELSAVMKLADHTIINDEKIDFEYIAETKLYNELKKILKEHIGNNHIIPIR